jgi:predicted amidohydrolase
MKSIVAGVQMRAEPFAVARNLAHAGELVERAVGRGARLVLLPERP